MKWPWVSRKKLKVAEGLASYWMDRWMEEQNYGRDTIEEYKISAEYWKARWYQEVKKAQEAKSAIAEGALYYPGAPGKRSLGTGAVQEVRPVRESRVTISNPVETGRVDGKAAPRGAAPGGKS